MDWLIKSNSIQDFMVELATLSLYGFGSVEDLLNMKIYEIYALRQILKDDDVKDTFRKIKLHNFN